MTSVAIADGLRTASTSAPARSSVATMRRSWSRSEEIARTRFDKVPRAWPRQRPACEAYHPFWHPRNAPTRPFSGGIPDSVVQPSLISSLQLGGGLGPVLALLALVPLLLLRPLDRLDAVILGLERALRALRVHPIAVDDDIRAVAADLLVPPQHPAAADLVGARPFIGLGRRPVLREQRLAERRVLAERLARAELEADVVHQRRVGLGRRAGHVVELGLRT